ncbi:SSU ribosomal protein S5P alanine acetyltransferase [Fontibacillus panacisegetis]|uniref:SSU ribosomal protein S5P alanine acetyltransferase n=1 Tax=Fontibacillus panacisegetis TaxID=670482 RepID=A0A1G7TNS1_9BACL|nr:GNAT family N-acetyltransferase [Fontibacillus panacisegetis]SDG36977.1 SSU ribosomal protein S5P alanine acetyltransferase [Fontibacillus panacisegetis]
MNLSQPFESKRLKFRLLNEHDIESIHRQFSDIDMCKYFSEPPCDKEEAKSIIEHYQNPEGKGYLRYGMFDKKSDKFIGTCGYHYWDPVKNQVEIGYDIWKEYWRQGYVTEALPYLINICFLHLGVECTYILTHPQNKASIASVKKYGFVESDLCRTVDTEPQICMTLLRADWNIETVHKI